MTLVFIKKSKCTKLPFIKSTDIIYIATILYMGTIEYFGVHPFFINILLTKIENYTKIIKKGLILI